MPRSKDTTLTARAREMHAVIESWQQSGLTQKAFCEDSGLPYTTFQHWLYHYRDYHRGTPELPPLKPGDRTGSGFIALQAQGPALETAVSPPACEIIWPTGMRLRLAALPDTELLQRLLALPENGS